MDSIAHERRGHNRQIGMRLLFRRLEGNPEFGSFVSLEIYGALKLVHQGYHELHAQGRCIHKIHTYGKADTVVGEPV